MKYVINCILLLLLAACSSSNPEVRVRPTLSAVEVTVRVGETAYITVNAAEQVSAKVRDESIATIYVSGNKIAVSGVKKGETVISITADGYNNLSCTVYVTAEEEPPTPEPEEDYTEILSDASVRFISEKLTLQYSTPGTIVEKTSSTVSFRSLTTGDYVLITQSDITINEKIHRITETEIAKVSDNVSWKKFELETGEIVWCIL